MSEERDDQGRWIGAFLLGLIVGALLMVGIGGGLWMVRGRQAQMQALEAQDRAVEAEEKARRQRDAAERDRIRLSEELKAALQEKAKLRQELERRDTDGK